MLVLTLLSLDAMTKTKEKKTLLIMKIEFWESDL